MPDRAGDFDVDGVDIVEEAGREDAAEVQDEPGEGDEGERGPSPWARGQSAYLDGDGRVRNCCSRRHVKVFFYGLTETVGERSKVVGSASVSSCDGGRIWGLLRMHLEGEIIALS